MSFDLSQLNTDLGAYARVNTRQIVRRAIYNHLRASDDQPIGLHDILRYRFMKDQEAFQRMDLTVDIRESDTNVTEQTDPVINLSGAVRSIKDFEHISRFNPYALENTYADHLRDMTRKFRDEPELADVEFVNWLFDEIIGRFIESLMTISLISGEYSASFGYAQSWANAFDGILKVVNNHIDSGEITNVVTTGTITNANAYAELEKVGNAQPNYLRGQDLFLICSLQVAQWYNYDYRDTWPGQNPSIHPTYQRFRLEDSPNVTIVPVPEMNGQPTVTILTPANNFNLNNDYRSTNQQGMDGSSEGSAANLLGPQMSFLPINVKEIQYMLRHGAGVSLDNFDHVVVNDVADQTA